MTTAAPTIEQDFAARMDRLGITQSFLAEYVGLSQSAVSKAVNEITDTQRTKISDALRELEGVAAVFYPMKPFFDDANAVKEWLCSPSLPRLFKMLTDAQLQQLSGTELTTISAACEEGERLEAEIAASKQRTRALWAGFLQEVSSGRPQRQ